MRTELAALRSVAGVPAAPSRWRSRSPASSRSRSWASATWRTTPIEDARSALSSGAVAGFVAVVYAAATAGGEVARGGFALALLGGADRRRATRDRLAAHARRARCSASVAR